MALIKSYKGLSPKWGKDCYFSENATIVGDVTLGDECSVWFNAVVRGDVAPITIGNGSNVQDGSCIHVTHDTGPTHIGNYVTIGHNVTVHACTIHDGALIGMGATLLDNCEIGEGAIVAAGALVLQGTKIPPREIWGGVPAKYIKPTRPGQTDNALHYIAYSKEYLKDMKKTLAIITCMTGLFLACQNSAPSEAVAENAEVLDVPECVVTAVPESLGYDPFYTKYVDVNGIPLVSSWRVPDSAFVAAHRTLYAMTSMLPKAVLDSMVGRGTRVAIMARYEGTTDIPEHRYLVNDTALNWDLRARGLGGDLELPLTSCAEENVLAYQIDKYHAEDILVHEFAHSVHLIGLMLAVPDFDTRLKQCYEQAKAKGLLAGTYRETDKEEYLAEAVQDWFNVNAEMPRNDGKHNWCNTREELQQFDPDLYNLLAEYFPRTSLQISKHQKINQYTQP